MKVLLATGLYPPDIGGPATYARFLETHQHQLGIELTVLSFGKVRKLPFIVRHGVYLVFLLWQARGHNLIYALDTISVGVPAMVASICTRKPLLLRVPGDYAWEQGQQRYGVTETLDEFLIHPPISWKVRLLSRLQSFVAHRACHVIVPSDYMKGVVARWGVLPTHVTRIYSVLQEMSDEGGGIVPFNLSAGTFRIATAARLVPWKGVNTLVRVVATLLEEGYNVSLDVYGDGIMRKSLETEVQDRGIAKQVTFHGAVRREVLGSALKASQVFVLNTSYEGLSHQLIEVMSIGIPIVTTPVGGNVELIEHDVTGLFVPYNDAEKIRGSLIRLMHDSELRARLGRQAQTKVERFRDVVIVEELQSFFKNLGAPRS